MYITDNRLILKKNLDSLYDSYDFKNRLAYDPIEFLHKFSKASDIEIAGFIASAFAYGRIDLFKPVIARILSAMGKSPYDFIINFDLYKHRNVFSGIQYRFSKNDDITGFLFVLHKVIVNYGGLENLFKIKFNKDHPNTGKALAGFVNTFNLIIHETSLRESAGLRHFLPSPEKGSACKRLNLFLRWMIRDRDIDLGIWKGIPKNKLVIPLDTHIARISKCLMLTKRKSVDWATAVEITESLKIFEPEDPLKYDFALCHQGVAKLCNELRCGECTLISK